MPDYIFRCLECDETEEFTFPMREHTRFSAQVSCACGGQVIQLLAPPREVFVRIPFPKGMYHEHIADKPVKLRDQKHFEDVCKQNGWTSNFYDGI